MFLADMAWACGTPLAGCGLAAKAQEGTGCRAAAVDRGGRDQLRNDGAMDGDLVALLWPLTQRDEQAMELSTHFRHSKDLSHRTSHVDLELKEYIMYIMYQIISRLSRSLTAHLALLSV